MIGPYHPLNPRTFQRPGAKETPEARFWRKFRNPTSEQLGAPVVSVHCCESAPFDYAVTSGKRVAIFNGRTGKLRRNVSRFKDTAYSGNLRRDGKLLVAGSANSHIHVFDVSSRSMLRVFKRHSGAVHVTQWSPDDVHILSCSDDKTARWWDLATERELSVLRGHADYVRCAAVSPVSRELWATGSYDHRVRLWDMRALETSVGAATAATMEFDHGAPVEDVLLLPGGSLLISAGGNTLKVWDVLSGGRLLHELSHHQKNVTALCLDGTRSRLLSASVDANVKVIDLRTYEVAFGLKYGAPVLALGVSANNRRLLAGLSTGELCVRTRAAGAGADAATATGTAALATVGGDLVGQGDLISGGGGGASAAASAGGERRLIGGTHRYFMRGRNAGPAPEDFKIAPKRHARLKPYDSLLRKFKYQEALDAVLTLRQPALVASMLQAGLSLSPSVCF